MPDAYLDIGTAKFPTLTMTRLPLLLNLLNFGLIICDRLAVTEAC